MLRYYFLLASRGLLGTRWLALLMVLTLGVGLAAIMTTNTLRYTLALDPIPWKSDRLLNLQDPSFPHHLGGMFGYAEAQILDRMGTRYADATLTGFGFGASIAVPGQHRDITVYGGLRYATAAFFRMLNVPLERGRIWTQAEARSAKPVVVINEAWASKLFPGHDAIGKELRIGETLFTVIGVTGAWNPRPRYYNLASPAGAFGGSGPSAFVPVTAVQYAPDDMIVLRSCAMQPFPPPSELLGPGCSWLNVWYLAHNAREVRLLSQAVESQLVDLFPPRRAGRLQVLSVRQILSKANLVPDSVRLYALLGVAFLALCVVNAAGMQLSRVLRSRAQIGIRRALGASRLDIVKQYLFDALLVGGIGGCLGIGLTLVGLYAVRHYVQAMYAGMASLDGTMVGILLVLIFVCSGLVGVVPAWIASRADPALVIKAAQ